MIFKERIARNEPGFSSFEHIPSPVGIIAVVQYIPGYADSDSLSEAGKGKKDNFNPNAAFARPFPPHTNERQW